jgi:hypothetical protein
MIILSDNPKIQSPDIEHIFLDPISCRLLYRKTLNLNNLYFLCLSSNYECYGDKPLSSASLAMIMQNKVMGQISHD